MAAKRLIVTDSTADLAPEVAEQFGIKILPVNVKLDGRTYRDRVDIAIEDFYARYDDYAEMSTSAVTYEDYALEYLKFVHEVDEVLIIHCSRHLSKTYETAKKVHADFNERKRCRVEVIDSQLCSGALGLVVIAAAQATAEGQGFVDTIRVARHWMANITSFMAIPTLKYLKRGKKIGGLKALLGLAMGVKPVMTFKDGRLKVQSKLFGEQKNMILSMMDHIREDIGRKPISLAINHSRETDVVWSLREVFESSFECREVFVSYFGPSIGINTGPETTAVMYYKHPF
jgi:DegV family protein with EDD domain